MSCFILNDPSESQVLFLNENEHDAYINGQDLSLTKQEYSLLETLAEHYDEPVSREDILRDAWGFLSMGETRTVDVHIQRLRRKMGKNCIETIYRYGYRLMARSA